MPSSGSYSYPQTSVPSHSGQSYAYPQTADKLGRSHRSVRYSHPPRPRKLSGALPAMNVSGDLSRDTIAQLEDAYERSRRLAEKNNGKDIVFEEMMRNGTDAKGRREMEKANGRLDPETRRAREVHLAQYAGFKIRADGTLDYGTAGEKCAVM